MKPYMTVSEPLTSSLLYKGTNAKTLAQMLLPFFTC